MKSTLITGAAITAALVVVAFDRVIVPSLVFAFRVIEASFAPEEPVTPMALPVSVEPIIDVSVPSAVVSVPTERRLTNEDTVISKPKRATRKRSIKKSAPLGDASSKLPAKTAVIAAGAA